MLAHPLARQVRLATAHAWARPLAMAGFALLTAAAAHARVPLPGTPVPLTLQVFVVLLAGSSLGRGYGAGSQVLYLALGAAGLPFFAAPSGLALLAAPTAGYLAGFPAAAWLAGSFAQRGGARRRFAAMTVALVPIYALGAAHLALVLHAPLTTAVALGVLPFVAADVAKAAGAAVVAQRAAPDRAPKLKSARG